MPYTSFLLNSPSTNLTYQDTTLPNDADEEIIIIDSGLRNIILPNKKPYYVIGVAGDHNCETIFFQMPRYFDGIDLNDHDCVIRFINAGREYGEYEVENRAVDDNFIVFGWQVTNQTTRYMGIVDFTVQFETVDTNGIKYQWQTVPAHLQVLAALNIESTITDKDDTLFRTLTRQINDLQQEYTALKTQVDTLNTKVQDYDTLKNRVTYLENNVIYTLE